MSDRDKGMGNEVGLQGFFDQLETSLHVITAFEWENVQKFHEEQDRIFEQELRSNVSKLSYYDGFVGRLELLKRFANKNDKTDHPMKDKVDHLFPTILNGIAAAVEMNKEYESDPEKFDKLPERLREKFEKNRLTVLQGRELILKTIEFVQKLGWRGIDQEPALVGLMRIWDTPSQYFPDGDTTRDVPGVLWSGGGEKVKELLGGFDPFYLLGLREKRS